MGTSIPNIGSSAIGDPIGKAVVEIIADDKAYRQGLKRSERALRSFDKEQTKIILAGAKGFAVLGGAIAAIGAIATKSFLTAAVQNEKLMKGLEAMAGSTAEANKQLEALRITAMLPGLGLPEAIKASINLQAVGIEAEKANTFILEMGNALASVGRGREDLNGVIRGMQQMTSRGKVLAEEINQISERVPQFRKAMQEAFGTATSEDIQKLGITVEEFLDKTVAELAKLPRVSGGASNAIENLTDSWREFRVETGKFLLPTLIKTVDVLSDTVGVLNDLSDAQKKVIAFGGVGAVGIGVVVAGLAAIGLAAPGITVSVKAIKALTKALPILAASPIAITIAGITAGIGVFAAGLKLGADQIDKTREALTSFDAVTKAQQNNIAQIQVGIDEWQGRLDNLQTALNKGTTNLQRFDQATKKWIDTPIGTQISLVEGKLTGLNKALRIAKGATLDLVPAAEAVTTEISKLSGIIKAISNPLKAFSDLFFSMGKNIDLVTEAFFLMRGSMDFLQGDSTATRSIEARRKSLQAWASAVGDVRKVVNEVIKDTRADQKGLRPAEFLQLGGFISDPDVVPERQTRAIDFGMTSQEQLKQIQQLDEFRKGLDEWLKSLTTIFEKSGEFTEKEKQRKIKAIDEASEKEIKLIGDTNKKAELLFIKETDFKIKASERGADERAKVEKDFRAVLALGEATDAAAQVKNLADNVAAQEQAAADVLRAWERTKDEIQFAFVGLFDSIIREGKADWQTFLDDLGRMFSRKFAEIAADQTVGALLDKLAGGRTGAGTAGAIREAAAGQATTSFLGRLFGTGPVEAIQLPGGGTLGAKIFGTAATPAVATTAGAATPAVGATATGAGAALAVAALPIAFALASFKIDEFLKARNEERRLERQIAEAEERGISLAMIQQEATNAARRSMLGIRSGLRARGENRFPSRNDPSSETAMDRKARLERLGEELRGDNFVQIDSLVIQMPDNINDMSRAELDKNTSRQIASTARAFKRDPRARRSFMR